MKQKIDCNWHKYVDLGLPSGLLWATCNIGASEPWENGLYFSWGNVDGHAKDSMYDYESYASTPGASLTDSIPVDAKYDAARAYFGGTWRMPTDAEFAELFRKRYTTNEWVTQNGVNGRRVTSKINGNSVFFPASGYCDGTSIDDEGGSGYCWTSSFYSHTCAYLSSFDYDYVYPQNYCNRKYGFPIRPVISHPKDSLLIKTIKR